MEETSLVEQARILAVEAHGAQKYGDKPYLAHLTDVVNTLIKFGFQEDEQLLAAAWLHDSLEDTKLSMDVIRQQFGTEVLQLVHGVTNEMGSNRQIRNELTYPKITATPKATRLKLADRIANVTSCWNTQDTKLFMYQQEYKGFRAALRREQDVDLLPMWNLLDKLLGRYWP